jgi:predicted dehydrogenase
MHCWGYASASASMPNVEVVGIWDEEPERCTAFQKAFGGEIFQSQQELLDRVDAVCVCSENRRHAELGSMAANAGKHIICEKPLVTNEEEAALFMGVVQRAGVKLMTAFPCRFAPAFTRLKERVRAGEIGEIVALCTTNRGSCPFGWFIEPELSGGGALIDHTVHVADLLRDLLGRDPIKVAARTGNNMYAQDWEDTAMLTLDFGDGLFATLDSSWSRPKSYKTWGDVTITAVGTKGMIEMDMFNGHIDVYRNETMRHTMGGFGTNLDLLLFGEFIAAIEEDRKPIVTGEDGLAAARVAMAGYRSLVSGQPEPVAS